MARSSECTEQYAQKVFDRDPHCQRCLWLLKNSLFVPNSQNWGDRKCLGDPRKSIVGHPGGILFLPISRQGVFQQPQAITLTENLLGVAMARQRPRVITLSSERSRD